MVDVNAKQTATAAKPAARKRKHDDTVPIAAGGVLALLALGSAAVAVNRRRNEDEEWLDEEDTSPEPVAGELADRHENVEHEEQPAILAPPVAAFAWRKAEQSPGQVSGEQRIESDDRASGETWVQRAYRGPSPLNPSVSLKTRLKRAAFFDKRERDAAAGLAEPVDPTAGLPERMVDESHQDPLSEPA